MRGSMAGRVSAATTRVPQEQQEAATAVAYVSLQGSRSGGGRGSTADGSPRVRYSHVQQPRSPGGQRAAPVLPDFIQVEEDVPPGAAVVSMAFNIFCAASLILLAPAAGCLSCSSMKPTIKSRKLAYTADAQQRGCGFMRYACRWLLETTSVYGSLLAGRH
jgi:hypothetical protein